MRMHALSLLLAAASFGSAGFAQAESRNPVFGKAITHATTTAENKAVVGKGYYADYYGYYGNYYNYYAGYFGNAAYDYKVSDYYNSASTYASYAANAYSTAAYYQAYGF